MAKVDQVTLKVNLSIVEVNDISIMQPTLVSLGDLPALVFVSHEGSVYVGTNKTKLAAALESSRDMLRQHSVGFWLFRMNLPDAGVQAVRNYVLTLLRIELLP